MEVAQDTKSTESERQDKQWRERRRGPSDR